MQEKEVEEMEASTVYHRMDWQNPDIAANIYALKARNNIHRKEALTFHKVQPIESSNTKRAQE